MDSSKVSSNVSFTEENKNRLKNEFKIECSDRSEEVDPESEEDWHSLTLGWAIAKGLSPDDASTFANFIRYHTNLG